LRKDLSSEEYNKASELLKDTWVKDFNTASELLTEIKGKVDEQAVSQNETGDALQNPDLPNIDVPGLNNPPEATTPLPVEGSAGTTLPEINPADVLTPTQTP